VAAASELFEVRGFDRTTVDQIAEAAEISRRTFFRYFADKEELFFAEDERLLGVIHDTLDAAPPGEPVLDLARRATRALATHSAADPERRLARERLIAATPGPPSPAHGQDAPLGTGHRGPPRRAGLDRAGGAAGAQVALACFQAAYEGWVRDPGQDLPALVDESFAALAGLAG
jgi:AcrR family transcriptional regulator